MVSIMATSISSQSAWNKFRIVLKLKPLKIKTVIPYQCQTSLYTVISVFSVTYHIYLGKHACLCILDHHGWENEVKED